MSHTPKTKNRTRIAENWLPNADLTDFALSKGVDPTAHAERFRDYHLAHGTLMANWSAAWRTWCNNEVARGRASGQRALPLMALVPRAVDGSDHYGAQAWAKSLPDAVLDDVAGEMVLCVGGWDAAGTAKDVCKAGRVNTDWRGDLDHIAQWLRDGFEPDAIVEVIRRAPPPREPGSWRYYDQRVRNPFVGGRRATG